jgi:hypothetical protein
LHKDPILKLIVYDKLREEVNTFVNENMDMGSYKMYLTAVI